MPDGIPFNFLVQMVIMGLASSMASVCAAFASQRYRHPGFFVVAIAFALSATASFLALGLNSRVGSLNAFLELFMQFLHFTSMILMVAGLAWVAFVAPENVLKFYRQTVSAFRPDTGGGRWTIVAKIVVIAGSLASVPAFLWALLICFAAGMKSAPHLTGQEALMGALVPGIVLLICLGLVALKFRMRLHWGYLAGSILASGICVLGLAAVLLSYFD